MNDGQRPITVRAGTPARDMPTALELEGFSGDPHFMLSLARGLLVLQAFVGAGPRLTVSDAARATGLARATARRCLYTLEKVGYVRMDGAAYVLESRFLPLARAYLRGLGPEGSVQVVLDRLRDQLDETCAIGRLDGAHVVYASLSRKTRARTLGGTVGMKVPAFCTSMGRVLLSALPDPEVDQVLAGFPPVKFTPFTATEPGDLRDRIREASRNGFSINDQELDLGLRALAVPIRDHRGRVIAALNAGGERDRLSNTVLVGQFLPAMQEAAEEIGQLIEQV
ncbi:MAG TPA: IclR family transcriptional regulator C-terminal domain-containing protein [Caulobacteraceae bacterium]|jgi:IclR family pca regulon transcriptional regulator